MADIVLKVVPGSKVTFDHTGAASSEGLYVNGIKVAGAQQATIADLAAIAGGEVPTEAEHNLVVAKVNAILAALETAGLLASA